MFWVEPANKSQAWIRMQIHSNIRENIPVAVRSWKSLDSRTASIPFLFKLQRAERSTNIYSFQGCTSTFPTPLHDRVDHS